jgi:hypothetical protein
MRGVTEGRTVWKVSAIIEATEQGARDAQEVLDRALCPDEDHPGYAQWLGRRSSVGLTTSTPASAPNGRRTSPKTVSRHGRQMNPAPNDVAVGGQDIWVVSTPWTGTCVRCRTSAPGRSVGADEGDRRRSAKAARWTRDATRGLRSPARSSLPDEAAGRTPDSRAVCDTRGNPRAVPVAHDPTFVGCYGTSVPSPRGPMTQPRASGTGA